MHGVVNPKINVSLDDEYRLVRAHLSHKTVS